jgi:hypothetical protein
MLSSHRVVCDLWQVQIINVLIVETVLRPSITESRDWVDGFLLCIQEFSGSYLGARTVYIIICYGDNYVISTSNYKQ